MKNILLVTAALSIGLYSCKKDDPVGPSPSPAPSSPNYNPMKVGSYWIYENYTVDASNNATLQGRDSVYVEGDTVINGKTFHMINHAGNSVINYSKRYLRDSADCVIDQTGHLVFSPHLNDTIARSNYPGLGDIYYIPEQGSSVTVPAGTFSSTLDVKGHYYSQDPNYQYGIPRYSHEYYSDGTGMIKSVRFYVSAPGTIESRLASYHIAP